LKLLRINSAWTAVRAVIGWPFFAIGLYFVAALIGSFVPTNNDWREPATGIPIFVETNGVHVSLILPMSAVGEDLSDLIRPEHLADRDRFGTHVMIGWGHGAVYRNAQTWEDVRSGDIGSAIIGSDFTTLHIYHLIDPQPTSIRKRFNVSVAQFRVIIKDVRATFKLTKGQSKAHAAYGPNNLFYDSNGYYTAINTCNEWTARVLRNSGVRIGIWTPMPGGVMRWF
jgi:uncharacterized protein (TIGR02117 family)